MSGFSTAPPSPLAILFVYPRHARASPMPKRKDPLPKPEPLAEAESGPARYVTNGRANGGTPAPLFLYFREDVEEENRGFTVHEVEAWTGRPFLRSASSGRAGWGACPPPPGRLGGKEPGPLALCGMLSAETIPRERFEEFYPTELEYLRHTGGRMRGWPGTEEEERRLVAKKGQEEVEKEKLLAVARTLSHRRGGPRGGTRLTGSAIEEMSREERRALLQEKARCLREHASEEYEAFEAFHVGKAFVRYVRVKKSERRRGIARALYEGMGRELARRYGMALRASDLRSEEAKEVWRSMQKEARGRAGRDPKGLPVRPSAQEGAEGNPVIDFTGRIETEKEKEGEKASRPGSGAERESDEAPSLSL